MRSKPDILAVMTAHEHFSLSAASHVQLHLSPACCLLLVYIL